MESHQKESLRRMRRNSRALLQDLLNKGGGGGGGGGGDRATPIPAQPGARDSKMIHSIASLIRGKSKLLLLESPDTVEIYKLNESRAPSRRATKDDVYLPAITTKSSSLTSMRGAALSQSCPYLYDKRRGSFSSVTSQRAGAPPTKQSSLKALREARKSNVTVTMTYLGQGRQGLRSTQDELKVLQQVNGGENICVFKGLVTPGEKFQFVSQRHRGFPFSATLYVNGIMVARISSCCEYRYAPGFQQGRKSCFRLAWLAGGVPCYRCTSLRNKYSSCQQLNNQVRKNSILPLELNPGNGLSDPGTVESCPSSPLFIPAKPETKPVTRSRRMRKHVREVGDGSTDSEDLAVAKETSKKKRKKSQQKEGKGKRAEEEEEGRRDEVSQGSAVTGQASSAEDERKPSSNVTVRPTERPIPNSASKFADSLQVGEALTKQTSAKQKEPASNGKSRDGERLRDFYAECVEMSGALEPGPNKHNWFKANILERRRLQKRLSSGPAAPGSDVELSAESDTVPKPDEEPEERESERSQSPEKETADKEQDLQAQLDAMMTVLGSSDEVEQLVLRNTDLTDDHLLSLAGALKSTPSEVTLLNLNLNLIGPYGSHILLDVLRVKPQIQGLHLFGNKLRDHGALTLLNGVAELQEQTATAAVAVQQAMLLPPEQLLQLPPGWNSIQLFQLTELDIGGNGLGSDGVRALASYLRYHSYLRYLGLAQTSAADLTAWKEFFDGLKGNASLTHIILDENNLGDPGVRLLADVLRESAVLQQVDLDKNSISDVGGNDLMGALLCRAQLPPLRHLSLQENNISAGLMSRIQEEVKHG